MSCCNGKCGCGSNCGCGSSCKGCGMYPDLSETESYSTSETLIVGLAPAKAYFESEGCEGAAENGCKCGANCSCDPCTCK